MTQDNIKSERYKGIMFAIAAAILWSTGGLLIKLIDWSPLAIAGSRSLVASIVMLAYIKKPKITKSKPQILGSIAYAATVICYVFANKLTTAANAIILQYTAPIFVAILGIWLLKEKIHWYDIASIAFVLLGMLLFFIQKVSIGNTLGNIIAIFSGFFLACTTISFRMQKDGSAIETTLFGNILTFLVALPFVIKIIPDINSLIFVVILGIFQLGIPYMLYAKALKYITALEAILITIIEPLLNPLWVFIVTGENPGIYAFLGGFIVISTVLFRSIYVSKRASKEIRLP